MAATRRETIRKLALDLINAQPSGLRYSELVRLIHEKYPEIPINTINGNVWNLDAVLPDTVYKPARGFKDKRGTPDVIGIREPRKSDIIKPPTEIVSAELKIEKSGLRPRHEITDPDQRFVA